MMHFSKWQTCWVAVACWICSCAIVCATTTKELKIVTTIFPVYDWMREIVGEQTASVHWLANRGVDLHSYTPTAKDLLELANCDLFVCVGGVSDTWVASALRSAPNPKCRVIMLMDVLGKSGAAAHASCDAHHDEEACACEHEHEHAHEHTAQCDEHIWLSLRLAERCCVAMARAVAEMDPQHAVAYRTNVERYTGQLRTLDAAYQAAVVAGQQKTVVFGDRFPFRYLCDDYGIAYEAAFMGCSAETEASFKTITRLAQVIDKLNVPVVLTIDNSRPSVAKAIIKNTRAKNQKIVSLQSMQAITTKDVEAGATYLQAMQKNLRVWQQALQTNPSY